MIGRALRLSGAHICLHAARQLAWHAGNAIAQPRISVPRERRSPEASGPTPSILFVSMASGLANRRIVSRYGRTYEAVRISKIPNTKKIGGTY